MILVQDLRNQLAFALDAEGSDHYRDDLDYIPAINASIKYVTNIISTILGEEKVTEEILRDLTYSGVFKTNNKSRVSLNVFPSEMWTILAVYVKPDTIKNNNTVTLTPNKDDSYFINNLTHLSSSLSCKRLSIEEWATNKDNPLEYGYDGDAICDELKIYAYLNPITHNSSAQLSEIEVRPTVKNDYITIFWVKKPNVVASMTDVIEFPDMVFQFLFNKALNYISFKQGDGTNINEITQQEIGIFLSSIKTR